MAEEDSLSNYAAQIQSVVDQGRNYMMGETQRILAQDAPAARALSDMMSPLFTGGRPLSELRASGSLMDRVIGQAVPMLGAAGADLLGFGVGTPILATQNMFAQGGMTVRGPNGESMPLNGYGYGAEVLSNQMWERTRNDIFNPNGSIRFSNTYGATPEDIGQITQLMQQRGAFAGMQAGQMEVLSGSRLSQLRGEAAQSGNQNMMQELDQLSAGDTFLTLDPGMADKVSGMRDKVVRTVQELRQVLGNLGSQEILSELERLTGVDVANPDSVRAGAAMLQRSMSAGGAAGLSAQQSLEFRAATVSTLDATMSGMAGLPSGSFYRVAANMSGAVDSFAHAAFSEQQRTGGYRTRGEIAARTSADISTLLLESPEMVESLYAASRMQEGSAGREAIMASVNAYQSAGTEEARMMARRNQAAVLEQHYQVRSGSLIGNIGMDNMLDSIAQRDPALLQQGAGVLAQTNQASMVGDFRRFLSTSNSDAVAALGGLDNGARLMHGMFTGLTPEQRQAALSGNYQALNGVQLQGFGDLGQYLSGLPGSFNQALNVVNGAVQDSPSMAALLSGPGASEAKAARARYNLENLNTRGQSNLSYMQRVMQGVLGGEVNEDDTRMVDYALGLEEGDSKKGTWVSRYKLNAGLGLDVDAAGANALAKQVAGTGDKGSNLYSMFGINRKDPEADAKLAAALAQAGGAEQVAGALGKDPAQILNVNENGKGASLDIIKNPTQIRERLNKDLEEIRSGSPIDKAAQTATSMQTKQPVAVTFNITTPSGPQQLTGTMVT